MKITIDTKEDSHEDIRKVIRMLHHLVGEQTVTSQPDIFEDPCSFGVDSANQEVKTSSEGNVFGNLFDTPVTQLENTQSGTSETEEETPEAEEKEDDMPEVIPY